MSKPLYAPKRLLSAALTLALIAGQTQIVLAEDLSTTITNGATSALGAATQGIGTYASSTQQLQSMVNQLASMNSLPGQSSPQMTALNQMKMNLSLAVSEAQMCVQNSKKDTSKYKKATIDGKSIETVEATCGNYGNLIDSLKKNADQMNEVSAKMACVRTLQNKINQIAQTAKTPFSQLVQAANKVWGTRDKIITIHKNIADQIKNDVDGKNGFRDQLGKLQKLAIDMNTKVANLGTRVKDIREMRVATANAWYADIMRRTQSCYEGSSQACFGGTAMSPAACVERYIGKTTKDSPVSRAQAGKNSEISAAMNSITANKMMEVAQQIQGDAKDPVGFLAIVDGRFNQMLNETAQEIGATQFVGKGVSSSELSSFVRARYRTCYNSAVNQFKAKMNSEGNQYKTNLRAITTAEDNAALEAKNLIQSAKNAMTSFKTAFTKTYNRDLSQFTSTCTANNDPNESVDCLRKIQGMLNSGINGHPEEVMLNNGTKINVDAGTTAISIPNLQLDAQGNPAPGAATTTCAGFQECITVMSNARESHEKAVQTETLNQEKFVEQNNSDIQTLMGGIATSFTSMSEMITSAVTGLNQDLVNAGVTASLETKEAKGEELEKDEKTGLYKTPKDMKAAFAGVGSYSEMGESTEVVSSINDRKKALAKKFNEAALMKSQCEVKKSDYTAVANALGDCDSAKVCKQANVSKFLSPLEALLRKSQPKASKEEKSKIADNYNRCMRSAKNATPDDDDSDEIDSSQIAATADEAKRDRLAKARADQKREKKRAKAEAVKEERQSCAEQAGIELDTLANESRSSLKAKNGTISAAIKKIGENCGGEDEDTEEAASACEQAKSLLNGYTPPVEGETILSTGESSKSESVIKGSGAQ